MSTDRKLTLNEWAIICTVCQEPRYQFAAEELRAARRMAGIGYLRERAERRFTVTRLGAAKYKQENARA